MSEGGGRGGEWAEDGTIIQDTFQAPAGSGRGQRSGGGGGDRVVVCAREPKNICGHHAPPHKGGSGADA